MKNILPQWLYDYILERFTLREIQEMRIRRNQPIQICYKGKWIELKHDSGLYLKSMIANQELIDYIISVTTKRSMYAFEDQIKNGYIVGANGIRIGLCGTAVVKNKEIHFIKGRLL